MICLTWVIFHLLLIYPLFVLFVPIFCIKRPWFFHSTHNTNLSESLHPAFYPHPHSNVISTVLKCRAKTEKNLINLDSTKQSLHFSHYLSSFSLVALILFFIDNTWGGLHLFLVDMNHNVLVLPIKKDRNYKAKIWLDISATRWILTNGV